MGWGRSWRDDMVEVERGRAAATARSRGSGEKGHSRQGGGRWRLRDRTWLPTRKRGRGILFYFSSNLGQEIFPSPGL